ncbi:MAG: ANTAR domain-containing protein [Actinomycetes bacterium]
MRAENRCSDEQSFAVLQKASSTRNEKLHEVARAVVAGVTNVVPTPISKIDRIAAVPAPRAGP